MTMGGRLFHTREAATPNARSPMVRSLVRGTMSQIAVAGVLPTHQSSANHWRDTEAPSCVDNGKLVRPVETTECVQGPAASAGLEANV